MNTRILLLVLALQWCGSWASYGQESDQPTMPRHHDFDPADHTESSLRAFSSSPVPANEDSSVSALAVLRGESEAARLRWLRRQALVHDVVYRTTYDLNDSTLGFRLTNRTPALGLSRDQLLNLGTRRDLIAERLKRDQLEMPPLLNFGEVIGKGVGYLADKIGIRQTAPRPLASIPSTRDVSILKVLWSEGPATSSEIYSHLDSLALTAKDLNIMLESMAARGLLSRRQISPQNQFTIFGSFAFEMSRLNAKNREYLYRPLVGEKEMFKFLNASAYTYQLGGSPGDTLIHRHLRSLMAMIADKGDED